jgi:peptidoglycan hydrolase CwlO-like protein
MERQAAGGTAKISLASVLDLSWSQASELRDLLTEFVAKLPQIRLDSKTELQRKIQEQQKRIRSLRGEIAKAETRIKDLEECELCERAVAE